MIGTLTATNPAAAKRESMLASVPRLTLDALDTYVRPRRIH